MINMLQVIFFILKAIGILLVSVLGILIALISIFLLIPIRYSVQAKKYEDVFVRVKAGWFFRILYFKMIYEKEKLSSQVRIFGFLLWDSNKPKKKRTKKKKKRKKSRKQTAKNINKAQENEIPKKINTADELIETDIAKKAETSEREETPKKIDKSEQMDRLEQTDKKNQSKTRQTFFSKIKYKIKAFYAQIKAIPSGLKRFILKSRNQFSLLKAFLQDEINRQGIKKIWDSVKKLVRHILPEKLSADLRFGTGDPCSTGQVLAIISLTYQLYEKSIRIIPDFEESVIEGNVFIKGRIRLGTLLIITIKLLLNKNFKQLKKNFNKLKEEL